MKIEQELLNVFSGHRVSAFISNKYSILLVPVYDKSDTYWRINKKPDNDSKWHVKDCYGCFG